MEALPAETGTSPTITFPALNLTVPTGAAPVADTVAVKVTGSPTTDGFWEEVSAVDVGSLTPRWMAPIAILLATPLKRIEPTGLVRGTPTGDQTHILYPVHPELFGVRAMLARIFPVAFVPSKRVTVPGCRAEYVNHRPVPTPAVVLMMTLVPV